MQLNCVFVSLFVVFIFSFPYVSCSWPSDDDWPFEVDVDSYDSEDPIPSLDDADPETEDETPRVIIVDISNGEAPAETTPECDDERSEYGSQDNSPQGERKLYDENGRKDGNLQPEDRLEPDKISNLEIKIKRLEERIDNLEEQVKTNAVIFYNIPERKNEVFKITLEKVLKVINKIMKVKVSADDIAFALRISPADNDTQHRRYRPVAVRFVNFATKMRVMAASGRLTRSNTDITVVADYSERVARIRGQLLPHLQAARATGKHAFLLYDHLVINGIKYSLEELEGQQFSSGPKDEGDTEPDEQVEEVQVDPLPRPIDDRDRDRESDDY